jgi:hypothetical protein
MLLYPESLHLILLEIVKGHSGCYWDESFACDALPAIYIRLVRYCCDKDHRVDIHHNASSYGDLKVNVVSTNDFGGYKIKRLTWQTALPLDCCFESWSDGEAGIHSISHLNASCACSSDMWQRLRVQVVVK